MKKIILKISSFLAAAELLFYAFAVKAQDSVTGGLNRIGSSGAFPRTGIINTNTVFDLIVSIIKLLLMFAGAIAVLFIIIGGFWYITSAGNEEQAEKGKNALVNAIIGVVIIVLSYTIINVIVNTVQCNGSSFFGLGC